MWEDIEWEEVSMVKALKVWANSNRNIKCKYGNRTRYYNGYNEIKIEHSQIIDARWFIEKI